MSKRSSKRRLKRRLTKKHVRDRSFRCFYCDIPLTARTSTVDHLFPVSKGGLTNDLNIVLACRWCNGTKDDKTYEELDITTISKYSPYKRMLDVLKDQERLIKGDRQYYLS